ncbi:hypothetical protein WJX72_003754 [[Myrmecia] bisecta]|uniref:Defective in cullin neddylation protein n=1 Tax=[Myrmecia] bisecta TaxID=41462 RepID=A0AAW1R6P6_9CHLO
MDLATWLRSCFGAGRPSEVPACDTMSRRATRGSTAKAKAAPAPKETDKSAALFAAYKDADDDHIGPEGIERLCQDLGVDPADRKVLLLAWRMGAQRMGFFTREEFLQGLKALKAPDLAKLKKALNGLDGAVSSPEDFQDFYQFAFRFCLTEPRQKIIDIETAAQMLGLVMVDSPHAPDFIRFLQEQKEYKAINQDQWTGFWRFTQEVSPDLHDYDESQAWPLLLDNYVEWVQQRKTAAL